MALSKPRPILQDMPPHIKEKIFNKLDCFLYKMSLQKAFPEFRRIIGNPKFSFNTVELICCDGRNRSRLLARDDFEEFMMEYTQSENGITMVCTHEDEQNYERFILETQGNHIDSLIEMFECLVDNPKFKLKELMIDSGVRSADTEQVVQNGQEFMEKLENMLKNLKCQIKVSSLRIDCFGKQDNVLKILPYIDPDHLENLILYCTDELMIDGVDKLVELEQWKKVKHLNMFDLPDNKFPIENWWNFPKTRMRLKYTSLKDIHRLIQHFRRSKTFRNCYLTTNFRQDQLKNALGKTRVLVPHPDQGYGSYMKLPATKTFKRVFVHFPYSDRNYAIISTELERQPTFW